MLRERESEWLLCWRGCRHPWLHLEGGYLNLLRMPSWGLPGPGCSYGRLTLVLWSACLWDEWSQINQEPSSLTSILLLLVTAPKLSLLLSHSHSSTWTTVSPVGGECRISQSEVKSLFLSSPMALGFGWARPRWVMTRFWKLLQWLGKRNSCFFFALSCCVSSLATQLLEIEAKHNKAEMRYGARFLVIVREHLVEVSYTPGLVSMDTVWSSTSRASAQSVPENGSSSNSLTSASCIAHSDCSIWCQNVFVNRRLG